MYDISQFELKKPKSFSFSNCNIWWVTYFFLVSLLVISESSIYTFFFLQRWFFIHFKIPLFRQCFNFLDSITMTWPNVVIYNVLFVELVKCGGFCQSGVDFLVWRFTTNTSKRCWKRYWELWIFYKSISTWSVRYLFRYGVI